MAHSIGGIKLQDYLYNTKFIDFDGLILLGSFLQRKYKNQNKYNYLDKPILTLNGEIDGLSRISRIAESYFNQQNNLNYYNWILPNQNHFSYVTGKQPLFVYLNDIHLDRDKLNKIDIASNDISQFIINSLEKNNSYYIEKRNKESFVILKPIIHSFILEGYHHFKKPCYSERLDEYGSFVYSIIPKSNSCMSGVPWTEIAQKIMIDYKNDHLHLIVNDSQHPVSQTKPSYHLPLIHKSYDKILGQYVYNINPSNNPGNSKSSKPLCQYYKNCTLFLSTVSELIYNDYFNLDTGFFPLSAQEIRAKMKSKQSIYMASNHPKKDVPFKYLDGYLSNLCSKINQKLLDIVLYNFSIPTHILNRYKSRGSELIIDRIDKKVCPTGPCWINSNLQYNYNKKLNKLYVKSSYFSFRNKNFYPCGINKKFPCSAGMHYCKLLSPARIIEWIYIDSLKNNL